MYKYLHNRGVTAVELLIVLAILAIIFTIAISPFSSFRNVQSLNSASIQIVSLLNEARSATISSKESSQYGVHFETGRAVYFKGTTFSEPSSYNKEIILDGSIKISAINLQGSGSDVVFQQLTGETLYYGSIILEAKGDTNRQKRITVFETGISNQN
ncbi:MAG: prepilin-type N-terminal cleavage/methylation domain-containing protein [Patescibacteria group bacterium]